MLKRVFIVVQIMIVIIGIKEEIILPCKNIGGTDIGSG
jgi:hypothetical protein